MRLYHGSNGKIKNIDLAKCKPYGISDLADYVYELPEERIARHPAACRDTSRLMVLERASGAATPRAFAELPDILARRFPSGEPSWPTTQRCSRRASTATGPRAGAWRCCSSPLCPVFTWNAPGRGNSPPRPRGWCARPNA